MYNITVDNVRAIIQTLKELDVRGFDSMNRVVGLVAFFENILSNPPEEKKDEIEVIKETA